ncbi:FecCD family ABC transporter permease [Rubritalea spongiae]|uniref:FecCD family ABC transporter permease n=1 Tax=Rubritalea spongiae TaxID=430797 RepID=A0ABW5E1M9_9BACT
MKALSVLLLVLLSLVFAPLSGESWISPWSDAETSRVILWEVRLPRVLLAFICGAALSLGGLVFQAMFRNALATPYTLGVASGSAFCVALVSLLGLQFSLLGISGLSLAGMVGAFLSIGIVYGLSRLVGGFASTSLLLGGVILGFFFSSLTMLVQHFSDATSMYRLVRWGMGSLGHASYESVLTVFPFVVTGAMVIACYRKELDHLVLGDVLAKSRGVEVDVVRRGLFFAVSLMVAGVVSVCGPIGFVGIIVPHLCRKLFGVKHQSLYFYSILLGGVFLVWCDTLARSLTAGSDLPVGIVTALLGGPFFLVVLVRKQGQ